MSDHSDQIHATLKFRFLMEFHRRPKSESADYFKLMYQSHFGLGHLVSDWKRFELFLAEEMSGIPPASDMLPLYEPITLNQPVFRLNLAPAIRRGMTPDQISEICRRFTQNFKPCDIKTFVALIPVFRSILVEAPFDMSEKVLDTFLAHYDQEQCRPIHHSDIYRRLYQPHYRVIGGEEVSKLLESYSNHSRF
jgi:hypothetical protein